MNYRKCFSEMENMVNSMDVVTFKSAVLQPRFKNKTG